MHWPHFKLILLTLFGTTFYAVFGGSEKEVIPEISHKVTGPPPKKSRLLSKAKSPSVNIKSSDITDLALQHKPKIKQEKTRRKLKRSRPHKIFQEDRSETMGHGLDYRANSIKYVKKSHPNEPLLETMEKAGLNPKDFKGWFKKSEPEEVHYFKNGQQIVIEGTKKSSTGDEGEKGKILNITDQESIDDLNNQRAANFAAFASTAAKNKNQSKKPVKESSLNSQSYRVSNFNPGVRDDEETEIDLPENLEESIQGPDHSFNMIDENDINALLQLREKTVSLGHGGEIIIEIEDGGHVIDKPGADFVIYENPFRFGDGLISRELAHVGVALEDEPHLYRWFTCDPSQNILISCAGMIPTSEGGDKFDLAEVGLEKIRYIKIKDTKLNFNNFGINTEGFDLDALKLLHFY
jgi:hypothetical protein